MNTGVSVWNCVGLNGGTDENNCQATYKVNGKCGAADGGGFTSLTNSSAALCTYGALAGNAVNYNQKTNKYSWGCNNINDSSNGFVSCSADKNIDGTCGAANGKQYIDLLASDSTLCANGTVSNFGVSTTSFNWICLGGGLGKSSGQCSSTKIIPPGCGTIALSTSIAEDSFPQTASQLCDSNSTLKTSLPIVPNKSSPTIAQYEWNCQSATVPNPISCIAKIREAGQCKTFGASKTNPASCLRGVVANSGQDLNSARFSWSCNGNNGGASSPSCSANMIVDGKCNTNIPASVLPPTNSAAMPLCLDNTISTNVIIDSVNKKFTWSCNGKNGGLPASCSSTKSENGTCATPKVAIKAISDLSQQNGCSTGAFVSNSVSLNATTNTFHWTCSGTDVNTTAANCSVAKTVDGTCNTTIANLSYATITNVSNATPCSQGQSSSIAEITDSVGNPIFQWTCQGSGPYVQNPANCSAKRIVNGSCGTLHRTTSSIPANSTPFANATNSALCATGTPSSQNSSDPMAFKWTCNGINTNQTANCKIPKTAECDSNTVNNGAYNASATNFCLSGSPSVPIKNNGVYSWTCTDSIGYIKSCISQPCRAFTMLFANTFSNDISGAANSVTTDSLLIGGVKLQYWDSQNLAAGKQALDLPFATKISQNDYNSINFGRISSTTTDQNLIDRANILVNYFNTEFTAANAGSIVRASVSNTDFIDYASFVQHFSVISSPVTKLPLIKISILGRNSRYSFDCEKSSPNATDGCLYYFTRNYISGGSSVLRTDLKCVQP